MRNFEIQSHSGPYSVMFDDTLLENNEIINLGTHFIIDKNVLGHLNSSFYNGLHLKGHTVITATEDLKSYQGIGPIIEKLLEQGLKRDSVLVAIGGGITQDIACFIASTFMRGIKWVFVPTTLLAQADSCIGSKSSINFGSYKNLLGTFNAPNQVFICNQFLSTLEEKDFKSGLGEIIKLFLIDNQILDVGYVNLFNISDYVYQALQIKKRFIEEDEFDRGIRNILNYGHCFGHAIESATNFKIPHGLAVCMGMDVANKLSFDQGYINDQTYSQLHTILYDNYVDFKDYPIKKKDILPALFKDKKNTGNKINIVLPVNNTFEKQGFEKTPEFTNLIEQLLEQMPFRLL